LDYIPRINYLVFSSIDIVTAVHRILKQTQKNQYISINTKISTTIDSLQTSIRSLRPNNEYSVFLSEYKKLNVNVITLHNTFSVQRNTTPDRTERLGLGLTTPDVRCGPVFHCTLHS